MLNLLTITYLFLGGAGAGACVVLVIMGAFVPRSAMRSASWPFSPSLPYRQLFGAGYAAAATTCLSGALCLILDLSRPEALVVLLRVPDYNVVSIGAYSLAILCAGAAALTVIFARNAKVSPSVVCALRVVVVATALVVMVYTALLLQSFGRRPFFRSPLLVVLFALSSLSTGSAIVVLSSLAFRTGERFASSIMRVLRLDAVVVVAELAVLAVFMLPRVPEELAGRPASGWQLVRAAFARVRPGFGEPELHGLPRRHPRLGRIEELISDDPLRNAY